MTARGLDGEPQAVYPASMSILRRWLAIGLGLAAGGCLIPVQAPRGEALEQAAVSAPRAGAASPAAQRVLDEAQRVLSNRRSTTYSHRTKVDEEAGQYETDCSGLVNYVLKRASPLHLALLAAEAGRKRPRAVEFYTVFAERVQTRETRAGWAGVARLVDARPGDIIAWRRREFLPGQSTGHVVILAEPPVAESALVVRAVVIDSTTAPHADDSRPGGSSGVGRGTMWFRVDDGGAPLACRGRAQAKWGAFAIAIGRPVELPPEPYNGKRRQVPATVSLNRALSDVSLCVTMRKPFDVLAEGLSLIDGRGEWI